MLCVSSFFNEAVNTNNNSQLAFSVKHQKTVNDIVQVVEENESDDDIDIQVFHAPEFLASISLQTGSTQNFPFFWPEPETHNGPIYIKVQNFRI